MPLLERTPPKRLYPLQHDEPEPEQQQQQVQQQHPQTPAIGISSPASRLASRLAASHTHSSSAFASSTGSQPSDFAASIPPTSHATPGAAFTLEDPVPHPLASTSPVRPAATHPRSSTPALQPPAEEQQLRRTTSSSTLGAVFGAAVTALRRSTGLVAPPSPLPAPAIDYSQPSNVPSGPMETAASPITKSSPPPRLGPDSAKPHAEQVKNLQHAIDALRVELKAAQDGERRAREDAEGWAAECDVLQQQQQQQQSHPGPSSGRPSTRPSLAPGAFAFQQQQQRHKLDLALNAAKLETQVVRVSAEYATLLTVTSHNAEARARIEAQFAAMRARYARKRAERAVASTKDECRSELDKGRREWEHEKIELQDRLKQLETVVVTERERLALESRQVAAAPVSKKRRLAAEDERPFDLAKDDEPRASSPASPPPARSAPTCVQAPAAEPAKPSKKAAVDKKPSKSTERVTKRVLSSTDDQADMDDSIDLPAPVLSVPPKKAAASKKAGSGPEKVAKRALPSAEEQADMDDSFNLPATVPPSTAPKKAGANKKTSNSTERVTKRALPPPPTEDQMVDDSSNLPATATASAMPKKAKKQRLLGGAGAGYAGGGAASKGLSFLSGAGATAVLPGSTVSAMRKNWASEEVSDTCEGEFAPCFWTDIAALSVFSLVRANLVHPPARDHL
ncbi:hypothetical protein V8E36_009936 [Tilletia maclaganii]